MAITINSSGSTGTGTVSAFSPKSLTGTVNPALNTTTVMYAVLSLGVPTVGSTVFTDHSMNWNGAGMTRIGGFNLADGKTVSFHRLSNPVIGTFALQGFWNGGCSTRASIGFVAIDGNSATTPIDVDNGVTGGLYSNFTEAITPFVANTLSLALIGAGFSPAINGLGTTPIVTWDGTHGSDNDPKVNISSLPTPIAGHIYNIFNFVNGSASFGSWDVISLNPALPPTATTQAPSAITDQTATYNGTITAVGTETPDTQGFVWDLASQPLPGNVDPTASGYAFDQFIGGSFGIGVFNQPIIGLGQNTTYYVRAFTHSPAGFSYGNEVSFTTLTVLPTVTTQAEDLISPTTGQSNATIVLTGGIVNDKRGVVFDTTSRPLPGNVPPAMSGYVDHIEELGAFSAGAYTEYMTSLLPATTYYVRAYSHNALGYSYGNEISFATIPRGKSNFFLLFKRHHLF